jgi:hypothetical protein
LEEYKYQWFAASLSACALLPNLAFCMSLSRIAILHHTVCVLVCLCTYQCTFKWMLRWSNWVAIYFQSSQDMFMFLHWCKLGALKQHRRSHDETPTTYHPCTRVSQFAVCSLTAVNCGPYLPLTHPFLAPYWPHLRTNSKAWSFHTFMMGSMEYSRPANFSCFENAWLTAVSDGLLPLLPTFSHSSLTIPVIL